MQLILNKMKDVLIISFPKCGRTWLTMILARIFQKKYNLPEKEVINIEKISKKINKLPKIRVIHKNSPQKKRAEDLSKKKTGYKDKGIIFLVRDPRDVIVSLFFHKKHMHLNYLNITILYYSSKSIKLLYQRMNFNIIKLIYYQVVTNT